MGLVGCDVSATVIFSVVLLLSDNSLLAVSDKIVEDCQILVTESERLSMVGQRVPLAPIRCLHMSVVVSDIVILLYKSISSV